MTRRVRMEESDAPALGAALGEVDRLRDSVAVLASSGARWEPVYSVDMRYMGQRFDMHIRVAASELETPERDDIVLRVEQVYEDVWRYRFPVSRRRS